MNAYAIILNLVINDIKFNLQEKQVGTYKYNIFKIITNTLKLINN